MQSSDTHFKQLRPGDTRAVQHLLLPLLLLCFGAYLSSYLSIWIWIIGQCLLGLFLFQCFILLHEAGHYSFFRNRTANLILGHLSGILSFIPFSSWVSIHNLHHRWTGWRDKDPTTEGTVAPDFGKPARLLVNICWALGLPLFTISYRLGNYWNHGKLKRFLPAEKLKGIYLNQLLIVMIYGLAILFYGDWLMKHVLLAYLLGLMFSDIFILSQHSHIDIPIAGGQEVKPLRYAEQLRYSRSLGFHRLISRFLFLNFNLHELHHAHPGIPAYHLSKLPQDTPNRTPFLRYLKKAKRMSGMKFIFSTGKEI